MYILWSKRRERDNSSCSSKYANVKQNMPMLSKIWVPNLSIIHVLENWYGVTCKCRLSHQAYHPKKVPPPPPPYGTPLTLYSNPGSWMAINMGSCNQYLDILCEFKLINNILNPLTL